jgi:hypothetical protein
VITFDHNAADVARAFSMVESAFNPALKDGGYQIARETEGRYQSIVGGWRHSVPIRSEVEVDRGLLSVTTAVEDPIFGYLDEGTRPYIINVRNARSLVSAEGQFFGPTVRHPGIRARRYTEKIQGEMNTVAPRIIEDGIQDVLRKARLA